MDFTVGTDQEVFLKNLQGLVSAIPLIPGTKLDPHPLPSGGTIQRDNVAMEFATPPVKGEKAFVAAIKKCLRESLGFLPEDHEASVSPSALFPEDQLNCPEAQEFGCEPDYDAWTVSINDPPCARNPQFRSCGGHLHIGHLPDSGTDFLKDFEGVIKTVKAFDLFLGIPFCMLDSSQEGVARKELYGKAGCHRPKDYGFEYRTLSNYWLRSPELVKLVHRLANHALKLVSKGHIDTLLESVGEEVIRNTIDSGNIEKAKEIYQNVVAKSIPKSIEKQFSKCLEKDFGNLTFEWSL